MFMNSELTYFVNILNFLLPFLVYVKYCLYFCNLICCLKVYFLFSFYTAKN